MKIQKIKDENKKFESSTWCVARWKVKEKMNDPTNRTQFKFVLCFGRNENRKIIFNYDASVKLFVLSNAARERQSK